MNMSSSDERVRIAFMKQQGFTIRAMARDLNRSPSTLIRELRRNEAPPGGLIQPQRWQNLGNKSKAELMLPEPYKRSSKTN